MTAFDPSVIQWSDVFISSVLVLISIFIVKSLSLDIAGSLAIGAFRSFVQLIFLGYILHFIFGIDRAWMFFSIIGFMVLYAGFEGTRRQTIKIKDFFYIQAGSLALSVFIVLGLILIFILNLDPWYNPIISIPLGGMIIGQALNSSSLLANTFCQTIRNRQLEIETVLSLGATRWQAIKPLLQESIKNALIPSINSLNTVGIVTIPGVMVGALLGGVQPLVAVKYQILVMYLWISGTTIACTLVGLILAYKFLNKDHQLEKSYFGFPVSTKPEQIERK